MVVSSILIRDMFLIFTTTFRAQWLRHYATNLRSPVRFPVASLDFLVMSPSDRSMALGSTQPLVIMGEGGQCVRLTTLAPSCAVVMKCGNLNFLEPSGPLQACNGTPLTYINIFTCTVTLQEKDCAVCDVTAEVLFVICE